MQELFSRIANFIPTVHGWCTVEKAHWLARWIIERQCTLVVEIGVFGGSSLVPMALAMDYIQRLGIVHGCQLVGVDAYSNDTAETNDLEGPNKAWWKAVDLAAVQKSAQEAVISHKVGHIVDFMICPSKEAVERFDDLSLDLVHVDGSHNEEESTRDVKMWWPKLRAGGLMVLDDTNWPSLMAARGLVSSLGNILYHHETWEAYQKAPSHGSVLEAPQG